MSGETANVSSKTPRRPDRPTLWIVAGPNGSGKSSLYNRTDIEGWGGSVWIINPDLLTQHIVDRERTAIGEANVIALQRIQRWLDASIDTYQTIGVETVLSSSKYRHLVQWARLRGFQVNMIYVVLRDAALQLERIKIRVSEGGHDVPLDKVLSRRLRSFDQLSWFLKNVDRCYVFDNSTGEPALIAERLDFDTLLLDGALPSDMADALLAGGIRMADWREHLLG